MNQKITACAFLHHNGRLFVAKRAMTKKFLPGKFELPGGHIEFGEDIETGLKREFLEEFGLEVTVSEPFYAFTYVNGEDHAIEVDYLVQLVNPKQTIKLNPEEHSESRWVTRSEVDKIWDKKDAEYTAIQKGFDILKKSE